MVAQNYKEILTKLALFNVYLIFETQNDLYIE